MDSVATSGVVATMTRKPRDEDERRDLSGEACAHSLVWERKKVRYMSLIMRAGHVSPSYIYGTVDRSFERETVPDGPGDESCQTSSDYLDLVAAARVVRSLGPGGSF